MGESINNIIFNRFKDGDSIKILAEATGLSYDAIKGRLRRAGLKSAQDSKAINKFVWGESEQAKASETPHVLLANNKNKRARFGLVGDTHLNSKYAQITYLHDFYNRIFAAGIDTVYHCGDVDEGEQMRPGHQYECHNQGADDHVDFITRVYPRVKGVTTYFITGNHDASIMRRCGYNIGRAIASARDDMRFIGVDRADIEVAPGCIMQLVHPINGTAYALSYHPQKMIDSYHGGEKPKILAIGHYHKSEQLFYRGVNAFQVGTFQAQTPYMQGKGLAACLGGWIVEVEVDGEGTITEIDGKFIPYYGVIKDDYRVFSS